MLCFKVSGSCKVPAIMPMTVLDDGDGVGGRTGTCVNLGDLGVGVLWTISTIASEIHLVIIG